jgi:predicted DNA-binding protein with PD1-like motif
MKSKNLGKNETRNYALIFETGDEVMAGLAAFARSENIRAGHFTGIGAFRTATLAFFDWEKKDYRKIPVKDQTEVLVLAGDFAMKDGAPFVHAHAVLGLPDGTTRGGHLMDAIVRPTLEVSIEVAGALERLYDPESGLALISAK